MESKTTMSLEEKKIVRRYNKAYSTMLTLFIVALIVSIVLTALITYGCTKREVMVQTGYQTVYVEENQTLWGLSKEVCPNNVDLRDYIDIVIEYNHKDNADVVPGESIKLPLFEKY